MVYRSLQKFNFNDLGLLITNETVEFLQLVQYKPDLFSSYDNWIGVMAHDSF